jgi:glycerol-3-phosphate acyltransferase PlsX
MRLAVDVNGGDRSPDQIIGGALDFISSHPECELIFCADKETAANISPSIKNPAIQIQISEHSIAMSDTPAAAKKDKPDNTIAGAVRAIKEGRADCAFSCGNSGAVILNAIDILGMKNEIPAPALMSFVPMFQRKPAAVFDVGALGNRVFEAELYYNLIPEAVNIYKILFCSEDPSVSILNIGTEHWKGTLEHKKLYKMLEEGSYNFKGNIEGDGLLSSNAEIIITDGFTGNAVLKLLESFNEICKNFAYIKDCHKENNLLNFITGDFSYENVGAAFLLGVNGRIAVGHGKSSSAAVSSGLELCLKYCKI